MKTLFVILSLLTPFMAYGKEDCSLKSLTLNNGSNIAERLFYTGTCHYRNEEYTQSAILWKQLADMDNVDKEYKKSQVDVLNNPGYLMFFGLGVDKDQFKAIAYWKKAITLGQTESEYHLCHAYADNKEPTYNREKAQMYCAKALLVYRGMEPRNEQILSLVEGYYEQVK